MTFAYETVTNDFDKRIKLTSIVGDASDYWARGAMMLRTGTNSYNTSFQVVASNPLNAQAGRAGFCGRALDGQNYTWFSRYYDGVASALPNQWLRLRRVGDYFTAYVSTNGNNWTLIGQRYQVLPSVLYVGPYAASATAGLTATVAFTNYGNTVLNDAIKPTLVSAGTLDKKLVGVRFSEPISSATAKVLANYQVTQAVGGAVTITGVKQGIAADAVYLSVSGLTSDTFTVTVTGGIQDTAGNTITAPVSVTAKSLNWNHSDLGYIQNTASRPKAGDDPGMVGQAVMVSSDENPEIEIVGGGSNSWGSGDFIHYIWRNTPVSGNFDVTVAVSRNDRAANGAGYGNSGLMLRALVENTTNTDGTLLNPIPTIKTNLNANKVQMVLNTTYQEGAGLVGGPERGSIPLWRTAVFGGYGNGNAGFSAYNRLIGGVKGYFAGLAATNASGTVDAASIPDSARYLRIKRVGTLYTFYASWNRTDWALVDGPISLPDLPDQLLLGFSTMNDTGVTDPPLSGYGGNGHNLDPADPYSVAVNGGNVQNEANYSVQRIKVFPNGVTDPLPSALIKVDVRPADEQPAVAPALAGSWTSTGTYSFDMTGGGTGQFRNTASPDTGGDEVTFAYETLTGDFDKQVRITSLTNRLYNSDGTPYDYSAPMVDNWARAGLMVRNDPTNAYAQCLKVLAANPEGNNLVRVIGRGIDGQNYTGFSGDYSYVSNALPNQYLRMKRVGNSFSCYVSKDGVVWALISERYQEMPSTVYFGPYCAASLNPTDVILNPSALISLAQASFTAYKNVDLGDLTGPVLISAGTLDKKTVGVKFNEKVSSATATVLANYSLSQGTVTGVKVGISGDSVYLTVTGLTTNTFTVTVTTNVTDTAGNRIAASSSVTAKLSGWNATDIGSIQNPGARPTVGDDPYRVGQAVATSSDDAPEVEIIGGGSNAWGNGDFIHYVYNPTPISGDFDVACKVSHYEHPNTAGQGGYSWGGVELRQALYNAGGDNTADGTKVPMIANTTYYNYAGGPGRAAIPLWRNDVGGGYGNGNAGYGWGTVISDLKGYFPGINGTNSVGTPDPQSSPTQARWLRIKRAGADYTFYASYNGLEWAVVDTKTTTDITVSGSLLIGYATMVDAGTGTPPYSAYGGNGHTINPADPLGPTLAGGNVMNESNYGVERVRLYAGTAAIGQVHAIRSGSQITLTFSGTLVQSTSLNGPWTVLPMQSSPLTVTPSGTKYYRVLP